MNYTHEESSIYDEEIKHVPAQQMLKGLNPSTQYKFSIKAKAFGGSGPWSEPTEKQFTTLSAGRYIGTVKGCSGGYNFSPWGQAPA